MIRLIREAGSIRHLYTHTRLVLGSSFNPLRDTTNLVCNAVRMSKLKLTARVGIRPAGARTLTRSIPCLEAIPPCEGRYLRGTVGMKSNTGCMGKARYSSLCLVHRLALHVQTAECRLQIDRLIGSLLQSGLEGGSRRWYCTALLSLAQGFF